MTEATLEGPGMDSTNFALGALTGRMDAADSRMDRMETTTNEQLGIVHKRFDKIDVKQDAMSSLINRWLGGLTLAMTALTIVGGLIAAEISYSGKILP